MASPAQLELYIKLNGGAPQTGIVTAAYSDSVVLSVGSGGTGARRVKYRILGRPPAFACPAGWTTSANGKFYEVTVLSGGDAPAFTLPTALSANWGKFIFDVTRDDQLFNGRIVGEYAATARLKIASVSGVETVVYGEAEEFDAIFSWAGVIDELARRYDEGLPGAGDVAGDTSSTSGHFARMHGVGGKAIRDAGVGLEEISQLYNVKHTDYGALGNDSADDSAAFTAAIAAAPAGQDIYVPDGIYRIEGVELDGGKRLVGTGTLKWKASSVVSMLTVKDPGTRVQGLSFDGNVANQSGTTFGIVTDTAPGATFRDCSFAHFRARLLVTDVADSPEVLVTGCRFTDIGVGTGVSSDCVVLRSSRAVVSDCFFSNVGDGHMVRVGLFGSDPTTDPVAHCAIVNNVFTDSIHNGITLELYAQHTIIDGNHFQGIDQAIKCESDGGTVFDVVISNNIMKDIALTTALNLGAEFITFVGNRCTNMPAGPIFGGYAICEGNFFENVGDLAGADASINDNSFGKITIRGNQIIGCPYRAIVVSGQDVVIEGNHIEDSADAAIRVNGSWTSVLGNVINGCTFGVVMASSATDSVVRNNLIRNASSSPISVQLTTLLTSVVKDNLGATDPAPVRTIAAGVIAVGPSAGVVLVGTEAAAATDDLDTITPQAALQIGHIIVVRDNSSAQDVTVKHATGNIHLVGSADFAMTSSTFKIALQWSGTFWQELWRSTT